MNDADSQMPRDDLKPAAEEPHDDLKPAAEEQRDDLEPMGGERHESKPRSKPKPDVPEQDDPTIEDTEQQPT